MTDRLTELLNENRVLCGLVCRDPSFADMELLAAAGCHVVWLDMEHAAYDAKETVRLCRTIQHLGMVPMVRIPELLKTHVQMLLDGGARVILLPSVRDADQAAELVRLCKFPPVGERGIGSTAPVFGYSLGADPKKTLDEANAATHLMVQFEGDKGFDSLDAICAVAGIDMVTVGPLDWGAGLGFHGAERAAVMAPKVEAVLTGAAAAGKITAGIAVNEEQVRRYLGFGVRILFGGLDVALKRGAFAGAIAVVRAAAGG